MKLHISCKMRIITVWQIRRWGGKWLSQDEHSLSITEHLNYKILKPRQSNKLVFLACKKNNKTTNTKQTVLCEMTKCLNERRRQFNVKREECFCISVHYGFQNGPFIMMCTESRKRAIKVTTICLSHCQRADTATA